MSRDAFCLGTKDHRNGRIGLKRLLLIQPGGNRFMLKAWALGSGQPTCVTTGKSVNSLGLSFLTCKSSALRGCRGPKGHVPIPQYVGGTY